MKIPFTGGCACGAIRYECSAEPLKMFNCHCRDCQRVTGSAFTPAVIVAAKAFRLTSGEPRYYSTEHLNGGENKRGFCSQCGSPVLGAGDGKIQGVLASTLDDPSEFRPEMDIFTSQAQPWDHMAPALAKYEEYMPL